jgi:hypothetical protein
MEPKTLAANRDAAGISLNGHDAAGAEVVEPCINGTAGVMAA